MRYIFAPVTNKMLVLGTLVVFFGTVYSTTALADYDNYDCRAAIDRFVNTIRSNDKAELSRMILFPLERPYPVPPIERDEFVSRYHQVFDKELVRTIAESNLSDWDSVGWRGLMLDNGLVWIDYDGTVRRVNFISKFELAEQERLLELRDELREQERKQLHYSLREYSHPVLEWKTNTFRIRIDQTNGDQYRYAAWRAEVSHRDAPDIVLYNGIERRSGMECCGSSGGGHITYQFTNGEYLYEVDVNRCVLYHESESLFSLRVWRSPGELAVVPATWSCVFNLRREDYKERYNYVLLMDAPFVVATNDIDLALHADFRSRNE